MDTPLHKLALNRLKELIHHDNPGIAIRAANSVLAEHHRRIMRRTRRETIAAQAARAASAHTTKRASSMREAPQPSVATAASVAQALANQQAREGPDPTRAVAAAPTVAKATNTTTTKTAADTQVHTKVIDTLATAFAGDPARAELLERYKRHSHKADELRDQLAKTNDSAARKRLHAQLKHHRDTSSWCVQQIKASGLALPSEQPQTSQGQPARARAA